MTTPFLKLDAADPLGYSENDAINIVTGARWSMNGGCARNTHRSVPVFDLENPACYLETDERLAYCDRSAGGFSIATWIDWRDDDSVHCVLHRPTEDQIARANKENRLLGCLSHGGDGFRSTGYTVDADGWSLVISVSTDDDCAADGGVNGTTKFYVGTPSSAPVHVGSCDVASGAGRQTRFIGVSGRGPGKLAASWAWRHRLSDNDVVAFWSATASTYVGPPPSAPPPLPPAPRGGYLPPPPSPPAPP